MHTHIARSLLEIEAIKLSPSQPFTWASGWKSPIYCDNRKILSHPELRNSVTSAFVELIQGERKSVEMIAGVATAGIAWATLVADRLGLPLVYVRAKPKKHGLQNLIEGEIISNAKTIVIEDLISSGGSSIKAVEALRTEGVEIMGVAAIFSYNFKTAEDNFRLAHCEHKTLTDYNQLIQLASEKGIVPTEHLKSLEQWRKDPGRWKWAG